MFSVKNVGKIYGSSIALEDVSFQVARGEFLGIVGKSGSGKSTLLRLLHFMEQPTSGTITFLGENGSQFKKAELQQVKQKIAMIFQQYNLLHNLTVAENVGLPLKLIGVKQPEQVQALLRFVGLADKADRFPKDLSGGEKQRVAIARALIREPTVLLCDEATSSLDEANTEDMLRLLQQVQQERDLTVIFVSHELETVKKVCNRVLVMEHGHLLGEVINQPTNLRQVEETYFDLVKRRLNR
ncbi:ATP-binding cassette domain-containing protein [Enterococcus camelliae]|uniref:ATP-binding cassette domain-containing protein n=1 Tax=Enterococcus camelliae TaxID=453959 RepID=A0ABW5TKY0_9ENTE